MPFVPDLVFAMGRKPSLRSRYLVLNFRSSPEENDEVLTARERKMGICGQRAACIADPRDPSRVGHALDDILRARVLSITCGYEDTDDLDALRDDPGFRLALGKLPSSGPGLASQPTMNRWENAPTTRELARLMRA